MRTEPDLSTALRCFASRVVGEGCLSHGKRQGFKKYHSRMSCEYLSTANIGHGPAEAGMHLSPCLTLLSSSLPQEQSPQKEHTCTACVAQAGERHEQFRRHYRCPYCTGSTTSSPALPRLLKMLSPLSLFVIIPHVPLVLFKCTHTEELAQQSRIIIPFRKAFSRQAS